MSNKSDDNSLIFSDGESIIDYVLVYITNSSTSLEKTEAVSKIREKFIDILVKKYKIQIQEVSIEIN